MAHLAGLRSRQHGMSIFTVHYQVTPGEIETNKRLVEAVFEELRAVAPAGFAYASIAYGDGYFLHLVATADEAAGDRLTALPAFQEFQRVSKGLRIGTPVFDDAVLVGNFRFLDDCVLAIE